MEYELWYTGLLRCRYWTTEGYKWGLAYHDVVFDCQFPDELKVNDIIQQAAAHGVSEDLAIIEYGWKPLLFNDYKDGNFPYENFQQEKV